MKKVYIFLAGVLVGLIGRYLFILCVNNCKSKNQNTNVEGMRTESWTKKIIGGSHVFI